MSTAPPWVDTDDAPTQGDTGSSGGGSGLIEWYRADYLGGQAEKWDERADDLPAPFGVPARGAALTLDLVDSPDTQSEIDDHVSEVEDDLADPGFDGGDDLVDDSDESEESDKPDDDGPGLFEWLLNNLETVVLAVGALYVLSIVGPGLAETAQAAGGD